jgi:photosystem II stability/assembly factor-like uncharacterized protein
MKKFYIFLIALLMASGASAQWFPQNQSMFDTLASILSSVYFTDVNTGYTVGDYGTVLKTIDGGENWFFPTNQTLWWRHCVFFINSNIGYAGGGGLCKTVDGGANWTFSNSTIYGNVGSLYFTSEDTGYAVGGGGEYGFFRIIYKTTDGGLNWIEQLYSSSNDWIVLSSVYFVNASTGYTVGGTGTILKTTDGGSNWIEQLNGTDADLSSVYFPAPDTGYIVGNGGTILKTTNGGSEWVSQSSGTTYDLYSVFFTDVSTGYAVGGTYNLNGGNVILKTDDGGLNWFNQSINGTGYNGSLNAVFFPVPDTGYIVGEKCILKTTNGGGFPVGISEQNKNTSNLSIRPNPTSNQITISTPTTPNKNTIVTMFNIGGQQIMEYQIAEQQTVVDVSGLPQGVYFVRIRDDRTVQVGKFVKQ